MYSNPLKNVCGNQNSYGRLISQFIFPEDFHPSAEKEEFGLLSYTMMLCREQQIILIDVNMLGSSWTVVSHIVFYISKILQMLLSAGRFTVVISAKIHIKS